MTNHFYFIKIWPTLLAFLWIFVSACKGSPLKKSTDLNALPNHIYQGERELVPIVQVEGKEYFVDPTFTNVSWVEAQEFCGYFNMTVGETVTANQHQQVWLSTPLFYNFWLGGTDADTVNEWHWITSNVTFNYTRWGFGEPVISDSKNCLFLLEDLQFWFTIDCNSQIDEEEEIYVLCENKLTTSKLT